MSENLPPARDSLPVDLKDAIRVVKDHPKAGVDVYDITTLMKSPEHLRTVLERLSWLFANVEVDKVVGIEARGFLFGPTVAYHLGAGFVPSAKAMSWSMDWRRWRCTPTRFTSTGRSS